MNRRDRAQTRNIPAGVSRDAIFAVIVIGILSVSSALFLLIINYPSLFGDIMHQFSIVSVSSAQAIYGLVQSIGRIFGWTPILLLFASWAIALHAIKKIILKKHRPMKTHKEIRLNY